MTLTNTGLITIDLGAVAANYRRICEIASSSRCAAVVKANAYGLGVKAVAPVLHAAGCRDFFVATSSEAIQLRGIIRTASIYVFEGVAPGAAEECVRHKLTPVLNSIDQVERWVAAACGTQSDQKAPALIHIDTGMTRLGFGEPQLRALAARQDLLQRLQIEYVMTHLARAGEPGENFTSEQIRRFDELSELLPPASTSIGNSAGTLLGADSRGDLVRVGIALYGGNPLPDTENQMQEVVRLQGRIMQVNEVERALSVGYGSTHTAHPPDRIATINIGYADGYPRNLGNQGFASIAGIRTPVVGRVSMDMLTIDVSNVPTEHAHEGALVNLIGGGVALATIAELAETIPYEVLTRLGSRPTRIYKTEEPVLKKDQCC